MKPVYLAIVATTLLIALGVSLVATVFLLPINGLAKQAAMLSFNINDETNMPYWCRELSSILTEQNVKATIFIAGRVAESHPECVQNLSSNAKLDIGSMTYSYVSILSIQDYAGQLSEVEKGKQAVDYAGNIFSRSFRAPHNSTDENIYSLLNRTGILADFSYQDHYNKYYGGYYIWFNVTSFDGAEHSAAFFHDMPVTDTPLVITFDNHDSIAEIREFVSQFRLNNVQLLNASDLTQMELTERRTG
ncbi:MAG TPA: polysaccharide deacetylase family protein [Nitrososphaerales archaeon]|nr:polysaccharide deacetylase family protein [Nitrososphaerales archaeon]